MTQEQIIEVEKRLIEEVVKRRKLGGYSQDADGLLLIAESVLALYQHLKSRKNRQ